MRVYNLPEPNDAEDKFIGCLKGLLGRGGYGTRYYLCIAPRDESIQHSLEAARFSTFLLLFLVSSAS